MSLQLSQNLLKNLKKQQASRIGSWYYNGRYWLPTRKVFKGNTSIKNQEIFVEIQNGNLKLPKTDILLDDNKITATGLYELAPNNININLNYNNENNKLLSLFNVNFKGNIKNLQTSLDYNKAKTDQLLGDILEKKMKKVIKDKLDNKFNDIIENLLE